MAKDDPNGRQGRRNQEMRDLRNRIHALETEATDLKERLYTAEQALNATRTVPYSALTNVCGLSVSDAVYVGIALDLAAVAKWFADLQVATGNHLEKRK